MNYYIASVKNTQKHDRYIMFWRPNDANYAWPLCRAGKYDQSAVEAKFSLYHDGQDNIAIPCEVVESLGGDPRPGDVEGDAGPVVLNSKSNWEKLIAGITLPPIRTPKPQYRPEKMLKMWNFGAAWMRRSDDPLWKDVSFNGSVHGFACAESKADAARIISQYCGSPPSGGGMRDWSPMWGTSMSGVSPERGLWLQLSSNDKPIKVA